MNITEMKPGDLKPYPANAKRHPPEQVRHIANSIGEFGFRQPIVVDRNNVVVIGHGRLLAANELGLETVPVVRADDLTEAQIKALRLADNKTNESEWDFTELEQELAELELEFDMTDFGFDDIQTESTEDEQTAEEDDFDVYAPVEPKTKLGDIYQLGRHRLMCGDSTDINAVDRLMDGAKADMILSDPPYGMKLDTDFSTIKGSMKSLGRKNHTEGNKYERVIGDNDDFTPDLINTFFANFNYVKEMFLFGADYFAELLPDKNDGSWLVWDKRKESQADAIGSEFELIWSRTKHKRRMLRHDWFGFLSSENGADARNRVHPTQKPVTLLVDLIKQWGEKANIIVDLFGGSGSTLIACEQLGRRCYMMELDPHYVDVIIARWENLTGQKAVLLN